MVVLVCGGRGYINKTRVYETLDIIHSGETPITLLIEGGAAGADLLGKQWAVERKVPVKTYKADWLRLGNGAGFVRNQQMLDEGKPDLVVAFSGGRGTADMVRRAYLAKVEYVMVTSAGLDAKIRTC